MKVIIEMEIEDSRDALMLVRESKKATGINVEVGRAAYAGKVHGFGDQDPSPARVFRVDSRKFTAKAGK